MDDQQTPQEPETTQIPVTVPDEITEEVAEPVPEELAPTAAPDVPGTITPPQLDTVEAPQPPAGNPVPATSEPSQDAVSINSHLENVQTQLQGVVDYCKNFLTTHPVAETVVADIETLIETVKQALNL